MATPVNRAPVTFDRSQEIPGSTKDFRPRRHGEPAAPVEPAVRIEINGAPIADLSEQLTITLGVGLATSLWWTWLGVADDSIEFVPDEDELPAVLLPKP